MIPAPRLLEVVSPLAAILPDYHVDEADINAALDHGVASCAARAYGGGLLLRHHYPKPDLYVVEFGFAPEHGGVHRGRNGVYTLMGHAATRFSVQGDSPLVVESYTNSTLEVVSPNDEHEGFAWMDLDEGYCKYLDIAGATDVDFDADDILKILLRRIGDRA